MSTAVAVRGLVYFPAFRKQLDALPAKHQSQVVRKAFSLMEDPYPGGSKTQLKKNTSLYRVRTGDYRIIYSFNDTTVGLVALRRRDEETYGDIVDLNASELLEVRLDSPQIPDPDDDQRWSATYTYKPTEEKESRPLPEPITEALLEEIGIPQEHHAALLQADDEDALLDTGVDEEVVLAVCSRLYDRPLPEVIEDVPVRALHALHLIEPAATTITGPLSAVDAPPPEEPDLAHDATPALPSLPIVPSRRFMPVEDYTGNIPSRAGRKTKYTVTLDGTVQLVYPIDNREKALLTTDQHPELVEMVNEAKIALAGSPGGSFYINEYRHVVVPSVSGKTVLAGQYVRDLEFEFEGNIIGPVAPRSLKVGDVWPGPHVGIPYTLTAGASDVRYEREVRPQVIRKMLLSDEVDKSAAEKLLRRFRTVKPEGGSLLINEAREFFAPLERDGAWGYVYLGHLGTDAWFPEPLLRK